MNPKSFFRLFSWLFVPNLYLKLFYINIRWLLVLQTWNNWCPLDQYLKFIDSKGRKKDKKGQIFQTGTKEIHLSQPSSVFLWFSEWLKKSLWMSVWSSSLSLVHQRWSCKVIWVVPTPCHSLTLYLIFFHQIIWMSFLVCVILSKGKFMSYRKCFPSVYQTAIQQNVISFTIICFGEMSGIKVFPHKTIRNKKKN